MTPMVEAVKLQVPAKSGVIVLLPLEAQAERGGKPAEGPQNGKTTAQGRQTT